MSNKEKNVVTSAADEREEFLQKNNMKRSSFSDADWNLYDTNQDLFYTIANYKIAYGKAKTAEERSQIHAQAQRVRQQAGYVAGKDGTGYYKQAPLPGEFTYDKAPEFSYDTETDPLYQAYKKQYLREGQRASENALGNAAAATGGIPSSYAVSAASQAGDYYAAQLSDKVPELFNSAYNRYANELGQYNKDRSFAYGQYTDNIAQLDSLYEREWEEAAKMAEQGDYSGYSKLGVDISNNPSKLQKAQLALEAGDYAMVKSLLGVTVNSKDMYSQELLQAALYRAKMGDSGLLNQLISSWM